MSDIQHSMIATGKFYQRQGEALLPPKFGRLNFVVSAMRTNDLVPFTCLQDIVQFQGTIHVLFCEWSIALLS